ncbi:hypothetical protein [Mycolicibacter acidiphilus]|nr:hypothetical protein [Mycolicibacter acidiphilus]
MTVTERRETGRAVRAVLRRSALADYQALQRAAADGRVQVADAP